MYFILQAEHRNLGELWLYMLRFYSMEVDTNVCVSIVEEGLVSKEDRPWRRSKRLTMEGKLHSSQVRQVSYHKPINTIMSWY